MKTIEQAREMIKKGLANSLERTITREVYEAAEFWASESETPEELLTHLLECKQNLKHSWLCNPGLIADGVAVYEHIMRGVEDRYATK